MLQLVRHGVAATVLTLAETVELHLRLMIGDRGILGVSSSVSLLLNRVEQAEDVTGRLEEIEIGPVLDLALEVLVASPQDGGENLM